MEAEGEDHCRDSILITLKMHLDNCAARLSQREAREIVELVSSRNGPCCHVHACILAGVCLINHGFYREAISPLTCAVRCTEGNRGQPARNLFASTWCGI